MMNVPIRSFCFLIVLIIVTSCQTRKDIVYFQDARDFETIVKTNSFEPKLKVGDIISIYVSTLNPVVAAPYNVLVGGGNQAQLIDYIIDTEGNIDFPVLGKVKVVGLTVEEAKQLFITRFEEGQLLKDPVIILRILNYRITVSGDVSRPGVYSVRGDRITILEAIGLAGDLNITGRRDNVLVIRDFNGTKTYTRIDLTNKEIFESPVYYLTQNDVIYVEPNNSAISSASGDSRINTIITITSFLLTTALIFVTRN